MTRLAAALCILGILGLALRAASAGSEEDRGGAKALLATANAQLGERPSILAAEDPAVADGGPNKDAAAAVGNPLWKIPLSALAATRERPLFSVSRRRQVVAVQAALPPRAPDPIPAAPAPPERPAPILIGTIVSPAMSVAMVRDASTQAVTRLREGEDASGWRLKAVKLRSVIVEKGDQSVVLELPKPLATSSEKPSANPLALEDRKNMH